MLRATLSTARLMARLIAPALVLAWGGGYKDSTGAEKPAEPITPQQLEFFEKQVRPILVEHCQTCHGAKKQEAGLRLDSAAGLKNGSDSGPVLNLVTLADSPLLEVVKYGGDIKMPPKGKLSATAIAILSQWVQEGARWPAETPSATAVARPSIAELAQQHWAFQPIKNPPLPAAAAVLSPVDAFVTARLATAGLKLSPPADRRTLIRRATLDLHGLAPTWEEVVAFEQDTAPQAFDRVVQRLLDSPRYGERWARHWLDVARYADTKGYVRLKDNPVYPGAWTYRDYVIRAFNEDLPYDQFILQQLAADQLVTADDPRPLAAMGFLTLGQRFLNSQNDIIDDRIDVVTRGLLGLTVTCARCHDHKFDPIPTRDYYSLHGIFASSPEPRLPPLLLPPEQLSAHEAYCQELKVRVAKFEAFLQAEQAQLETSFRARAGDYLLAAQHEKVQANFLAVMFLVDASKDLNPVMIQRWSRLLEQSRQQHHSVLAPWLGLAQLGASTKSAEDFVPQAAALLERWQKSPDSTKPLNPLVLAALRASPPQSLAEVAKVYGNLFQQANDPGNGKAALPAWEELRQLMYGPTAPPVVLLGDVEEFMFVDATTQNRYHEQQRLVEDWIASPGAAPHGHTLQEAKVPVNPRVFLRGNASNPGETVPRQFLQILASGERTPFRQGSGRLELAQAIVDRQNPLTTRVLVNRIWLHHFGTGLVGTPSDFGLRGEAPTHPELLDYLASHFGQEGWSIKSLHRQIMLSATYQQASQDVATAREVDPENRLLWKMNRRRLDWESLRDTILQASGQLDLKMGGPAVNLFTTPFSARRSIYGLIDRQNLPSILRTFDFAAPDSSTPQRHQTTVPQQALFLLNSPFLKQQTQHLAARGEITVATSPREQVTAAYRLLLGRLPSADEVELGISFLESDDPATAPVEAQPAERFLTRLEEYLQAQLLSNEFMFID